MRLCVRVQDSNYTSGADCTTTGLSLLLFWLLILPPNSID
jgi:hypothetical protein